MPSVRPKRTSATTSPLATLRLLGDPAVVGADGSARSLERRAAALCALAALEPRITRARAAALLWPESDDARRALRQQLLRFRKAYGSELVVGDDSLRIAPDVSVDALAPPEATDGELLGTLAFDDCEELQQWVERQRRVRRNAQTGSLAAQLAEAEAKGDLDTALALAGQLLLADGDSEANHRALIRLHYLRGDVALAHTAYTRLETLLRARFAARPSAETEQLARAIRSADSAALVAPRSPPVPVTLLRPPRMIGRAAEVQALGAAWQASQPTLLLGEPGLGKTRLLTEFTRDRRVLKTQGRPGDAGVPYATLARLLRHAVERCSFDVPFDQRTELARLLPELAPGFIPSREGQRLVLQAAIEALLRSATMDGASIEGVVFDDLHFADDASVEMLQGLVGALHADLCFAIAQRPGEGSAAAAALRDALEEGGLLSTVELSPLTEAEVGALIESLHVPDLHVGLLAPALTRHSGGNPLFALETLKLGLSSGQLRAGRLPRPGAIDILIERRLKQLSARALAVARLAAVAGVEFSIPLAERVTGERALALADAWNELQSAQVLRDTSFAHDLVADAVLRTVPAAIALHLHAEVAQWLQAHDGEPARIARHWLDARRYEEAAPHLSNAAERARRAGRAADAGRFMLQLAQLQERCGQHDAVFETLYSAADLLSLSVPMAEFEPVCAMLAERAKTDAQQAMAGLAQVHVLLEQPGLAGVSDVVEPALAAARRASRPDLEGELLLARTHLHLAEGDIPEAAASVEQSVKLLRAAGQKHSAAVKMMSLASMRMREGRFADALQAFSESHEVLSTTNTTYALPLLLSSWAFARIAAGDPAGASAQLDEVDAMEPPGGFSDINDAHLGLLTADRAVGRLFLGDPAGALRILQAAAAGPRWQQAMQLPPAAIAIALVMTNLGRSDLAQAPLERVMHSEDIGYRLQAELLLPPRGGHEEDWERRLETIMRHGGVAHHCAAVVRWAAVAPGSLILTQVQGLIERGRALHWHGLLPGLQAASAMLRAREGDVVGGATDASEALQHLQIYGSTHDRALLRLRCAEALALAGRPVDAMACLEAGQHAALQAAAALPVEFRTAYLQRQPSVSQLLQATRSAARLVDGREDVSAWQRLFSARDKLPSSST